MNGLLEVENISKSYGSKKGISNISFNLESGYTYGLLGMNGAGKTTIIKSILNQVRVDQGKFKWKGNRIHPLDYKYKRGIGYVPDHDHMLERLTPKEIIEFSGYTYQLSDKVVQHRMKHLLEVVRLQNTNGLVQSFSRGMRKKVQLVSALLPYPDLLILDEPVAGLDPQMIFNLKNIINHYTDENRSVLVSTHDLAFAQETCDYLLIMHEGELIAIDHTKRILENYQSVEEFFLQLTQNKTSMEIFIDDPV